MVLMCFLPLLPNAQQLPVTLHQSTFNKVLVNQYLVHTQDYWQFIEDIKKQQKQINIIAYDQAHQLITLQAHQKVFNKYIRHNNNVCSTKVTLTNIQGESNQVDHDFNVNKINRLQHEFPALTGEGMLISIHEPLFDTTDIDLKGRFVSTGKQADFVDQHTTDMATLIAGAGNSFTRGRGVAWRANMTSSSNTDTLPDSDSYYQNFKLSVQNHSYGIEIQSFYGKQARAFDLSARNNDQLLHVMSIGNSGAEKGSVGTYKDINGFANITGNLKMAKNILTVGAVTVGKGVTFVSSRGPAYDGRVKPEVVAYSQNGTSNATAIVTGITALLQQAYKQKNANQLPSATLLKAILINSAEDIENKGVDFKSGYGNINAYRAHQALMQDQFFNGTATQGSTQSFDVNVPANAKNLKITLVWNDPAATLNASKALVNDLDLTVNGNSATFLPWILNTTPDSTALSQLATRGEDHLNNIEQVTLENPVAGTYSVQVKGFKVTGNQSFYIAYQWDTKDQFSWNFPLGSDNMPYHGEQASIFRWESGFAANQTGKLEYSLDNGKNWNLIEPKVDLSKGFYEWIEPKDTFSLALARMTIGTQVFATETFTLSKPLQASVGFSCGDSVMIQWPKIPAVQSYDLYTRGGKYLQKLKQTTDTTIILSKTQYPDSLYSIVPNFNTQKQGIMTPTFNYNSLGVKCYLVSFFVENKLDTGLALKATLGTTYQVKDVQFERLNGSTFRTIQTVASGTTPVYSFIDEQPFSRQNFYRARIRFNNGMEVVSDTAAAYYLDEEKFIFFPNPITRNKPLNIFSRDFQGETIIFQLFNARGAIVYNEEYRSDRFSVNLARYPAGLYYYKIFAGNDQKTGKLILK